MYGCLAVDECDERDELDEGSPIKVREAWKPKVRNGKNINIEEYTHMMGYLAAAAADCWGGSLARRRKDNSPLQK